MRKMIAFTMAAVMALSLAGCSGKAAETTPAETSEVAAGSEGESGDKAPASDKVYKIATDTTFAPFEFENDKGEMVGIDLDLLKAIAEDQGFQYELQVVGFSAAVTALEAGECDGVIAGMSITDDRKQKYDFTESYFDSGVGMAVLPDAGIASYEDLKGKNVAAKIGTEGCTFAESIADKYEFTVTQFEDSSSMYQDVLAGNTVACFEDYPVMGYEISRGLGLTLPLPMEKGSSYGLGVLKGENSELVSMFNEGLANLKESGKYDEIINTYIKK